MTNYEHITLIDWLGRRSEPILVSRMAVEYFEVDPRIRGARNVYRRSIENPLEFRYVGSQSPSGHPVNTLELPFDVD